MDISERVRELTLPSRNECACFEGMSDNKSVDLDGEYAFLAIRRQETREMLEAAGMLSVRIRSIPELTTEQ